MLTTDGAAMERTPRVGRKRTQKLRWTAYQLRQHRGAGAVPDVDDSDDEQGSDDEVPGDDDPIIGTFFGPGDADDDDDVPYFAM